MTVLLSIRHRLAAFAVLLVVVVAAVNAFSAHQTFRRVVLAGAGERNESVARQLSDLLGTSARQMRDQATALARDSIVTRYLGTTDSASRRTLAAGLTSKLTSADGTRAAVVSDELWDSTGHRVFSTRDGVPAMNSVEAQGLAALTLVEPPADGSAIGWIGQNETTGALEYSVIAAAPRNANGGSTGYIVERRGVTSSPQSNAQLRDLIGPGTTLLVGNTRGDLWTNFGGVAPPPPVTPIAASHPIEYERPRGRKVLAAMAPIRNTPWTVAVEVPMSIVIAPVHEMLERLALVTLLLVLVSAIGAWMLSRSLTRPIRELVSVAEGMTAGDESERVTVRRMDELGVLGTAFNAMAERITKSRASLTKSVSDHVDAEARLRAAQQRLNGVIGSSGAVLCELQVDENGDVSSIEWISENVTRILGYDVAAAQAPGWWSEHVHPDDRAALSARRPSDASFDGANEYRFRHKDGQYRWLREECRVMQDADGGSHVVCAWLDITEQRHLADRLRQTQKMEAVGRLAGGVAHDFNNLLSVISGFSEILIAEHAKQPADSDLEALREIKSAAGRAAGLTRQLLAFTRQQVLRPHDIDLSTVVQDAERMLGRLAGDEVTLTMNLDESLPTVFADPGQVEQVLVNLVVNARDAMPDGGALTIQTRPAELDEAFRARSAGGPAQPAQFVALIVTDTGTGMTAEVRDRIFEPFFTTKDPGKGTGLGLSTVQGIVEQSGGQIFVFSEPGQGATFKLYFPCVSATRAQLTPSSRSSVAARGTESILLVEDEPAVRRLTTAVLTAAGYSVIEAVDGAHALKLCSDRSVPIDLVLTDMMMPVMGGRDLARGVRVERPGTPMVFMSGYSTTSAEAEALIANARFVEKPFTADALLGAVREMLDRSIGARVGTAS